MDIYSAGLPNEYDIKETYIMFVIIENIINKPSQPALNRM